jgi:hypothetical protein
MFADLVMVKFGGGGGVTALMVNPSRINRYSQLSVAEPPVL